MDNLDDSENNPKISDSAYSNSSSNSQSRRSHSSKSTHSGSSVSSGYGGKPSVSGSSNPEHDLKKSKGAKKRKLTHTEEKEVPLVVECIPPEPLHERDLPETNAVDANLPLVLPEKAEQTLETLGSEFPYHKQEITAKKQAAPSCLDTGCQVANIGTTGFTIAISVHDGVVMYTNQNLTASLGFPKDMWIGRSLIDFIHPKDHKIFTSQIKSGYLEPKSDMAALAAVANRPLVCRLRKYKCLVADFAVKESELKYIPFSLKFSMKDINEEDGNMVFLIIQATPINTSYKTPNECLTDAKPFVIKHSADGLIEEVDPDSVPYLGYIPQDIYHQNALLMYHPDDLPYLNIIYETIVKEGKVAKSMPFRMLTNNGDYVKLESEWSTVINPWSKKLEFVIGTHKVLEGPTTLDVFRPAPVNQENTSGTDEAKSQVADTNRESIMKILSHVLTKPAWEAKQRMNKRCKDLAEIMDCILSNPNQLTEKKKLIEIEEKYLTMLGGVSPHHDSDSKSSNESSLSYKQLNFNDNLYRYFESHQKYCSNDKPPHAVSDSPPGALSPSALVVAPNDDTAEPLSAPKLSSPPGTMQPLNAVRLTESLLTKHNSQMEKNLVNSHRDSRAMVGSKRKKIEHLARCNASFQPTAAETVVGGAQNGVKRSHTNTDDIFNKQQCTSSRQINRHNNDANDDILPPPASSLPPAALILPPLPDILPRPVGIPPLPAVLDAPKSSTAWQDKVAAGKASTTNYDEASTSNYKMPNTSNYKIPSSRNYEIPSTSNSEMPSTSNYGMPSTSNYGMPSTSNYEMPSTSNYGLPSISNYGMPSTSNYGMPSTSNYGMPSTSNYGMPSTSNYGMPSTCNYGMPSTSNYGMEVQRPILVPPVPGVYPLYVPPVARTMPAVIETSPASIPLSPMSRSLSSQSIMSSANSLPMDNNHNSTRPWMSPQLPMLGSNLMHLKVPHSLDQPSIRMGRPTAFSPVKSLGLSKSNYDQVCGSKDKLVNSGTTTPSGVQSEQATEKTDEGSSYSSFYSHYIKTDSDSTTNGSDIMKKIQAIMSPKPSTSCIKDEPFEKQLPKPGMDPELVFKYQIQPRSQKEVLDADLEKMKNLEQPALVNEQLGQLYLDMQLEGVTAKLTLEEGITSSSSSGDDAHFRMPKPVSRYSRREYNKLSMIYEENAPIPPPPDVEPTFVKNNPKWFAEQIKKSTANDGPTEILVKREK